MYEREMRDELLYAAHKNKVVTLLGPRQSGKTTLVRETFPDHPYTNLESLSTREFAETDPAGFLARLPEGAIIDEVQRVPQLLSEIQVRVDESSENGRFILTGSHQFSLHEAISQSLAGRTAILRLLPMSISGLEKAGLHLELDEFLYRGFYPRVHSESLDPTKAYGDYVRTYVERDLRQMIEVKNLQLFQKFLKLCAGRIGQLLNKENLANEVGVSARTIGQWLSILEASYIIYLLPPYYENFGKRMIKSPKLYFADVGLACYLLGIETQTQVERDPLRGSLVENLVLLELIKCRYNQGLEPNLYFYRDSQNLEVDILFESGRSLVPVEVKSAQTFNRAFLKNIQRFLKLSGERSTHPHLIYAGAQEQQVGDVMVRNYKNVAALLPQRSNQGTNQ